MTWGQWKPISEGRTAPGTPVTALGDGDLFQVFVSDPAGGVYTARGSEEAGWGQWKPISEGRTAPGTPVTALGDGDVFQVFVSDPAGGVYTARGSEEAGWGQWKPISEGRTAPGTPVTALGDGDVFQVFVSDPAGGVYTARGSEEAGWGQWKPISEGRTAPGTPVTALGDGDLFHVFVSDPAGGVYTARGSDEAGWGQWKPISDGRTKPGTPVAAASAYQVFCTDPAGRVDATDRSNLEGDWWIWQPVSWGRAAPGTPVNALVADDGLFRLFISDSAGGVFTAAGSRRAGWSQWQTISEGRTKPGTAVSAARDGDGFFTAFVSDPAGGVYTATNRQVPAKPQNLRVTNDSNDSNDAINLAWEDASDNEDGFRVTYHKGDEEHKQEETVRRMNATSFSLTGLEHGTAYWITVAAFNAAGTSAESNQVKATTTKKPYDVSIRLRRIVIREGRPPYEAAYPEFGIVQPGRLLSITAPHSSRVQVIQFVTNSNPPLVNVVQGETTTPAQMKQIFGGVAEPHYSSTQPVRMSAVILEAPGHPVLLDDVEVTLGVVSD